MQFGAATGPVSYGLHAVVQPCGICILHVVDSVNTNANCTLVPLYRHVSAVVNLQVVRKRCQTSYTICTAGIR